MAPAPSEVPTAMLAPYAPATASRSLAKSANRYPLAGEMALDVDLARRVHIPYDWALEIGMLSEVFRNCAPRS